MSNLIPSSPPPLLLLLSLPPETICVDTVVLQSVDGMLQTVTLRHRLIDAAWECEILSDVSLHSPSPVPSQPGKIWQYPLLSPLVCSSQMVRECTHGCAGMIHWLCTE